MDNGASSYRRFLDGDDDGFVQIVRDYKDGLMLYLNGFVNNIHIAEELTEETFVKLAVKKPKNIGKASFKTWLYTIGRNTAIDFLRRNSKTAQVAMGACAELKDEETIEKSCLREERKIMIHRAMAKLSPQYRQILWLIYFEGFSNKEAARIMKKTVHGTETLAYRARLALKSELEKEGFDYENIY